MKRSPAEALITELRSQGVRDQRALAAIAAVPREQFVPEHLVGFADANVALQIDGGQTISQPVIVAQMVELVDAEPGRTILDVGTGSGYLAAILSECGATVISIERIPELAAAASDRLQRLGYRVDVLVGDGALGIPHRAPFDGIVVSAAATSLPTALTEQLADGGHLVIPMIQASDRAEMWRIDRHGEELRMTSHGPCQFVPLISTTQSDGSPPANV